MIFSFYAHLFIISCTQSVDYVRFLFRSFLGRIFSSNTVDLSSCYFTLYSLFLFSTISAVGIRGPRMNSTIKIILLNWTQITKRKETRGHSLCHLTSWSRSCLQTSQPQQFMKSFYWWNWKLFHSIQIQTMVEQNKTKVANGNLNKCPRVRYRKEESGPVDERKWESWL